jgi:hypothetical protein
MLELIHVLVYAIEKYIRRSEELVSACRAYLRGAREKLDEIEK